MIPYIQWGVPIAKPQQAWRRFCSSPSKPIDPQTPIVLDNYFLHPISVWKDENTLKQNVFFFRICFWIIFFGMNFLYCRFFFYKNILTFEFYSKFLFPEHKIWIYSSKIYQTELYVICIFSLNVFLTKTKPNHTTNPHNW